MLRLYTKMMARLSSDERGQGTIEYVLVMVAVTAIAVVLISWARSGSGKAALGGLFDKVVSLVGLMIKK